MACCVVMAALLGGLIALLRVLTGKGLRQKSDPLRWHLSKRDKHD